MPAELSRTASQFTLRSTNTASTDEHDAYRALLGTDGSSVHDLRPLFYDALEHTPAEGAVRRAGRVAEREPLLASTAVDAFGARATDDANAPSRRQRPASARALQQRRHATYGRYIGAGVASMVGAQMVYCSDASRPQDDTWKTVLRAWSMPAAGNYGVERWVATASVGSRDAVASLLPQSLWLTRLPDKVADALAAREAYADSGAWSEEHWLLTRAPGAPYPATCLRLPVDPDCPEPLGPQLAARNAPYAYAVNGLLWGVVLGHYASKTLWKPLITDRATKLAGRAYDSCRGGVREVAADVAKDPPTTWFGGAKLAIKWAARYVSRRAETPLSPSATRTNADDAAQTV